MDRVFVGIFTVDSDKSATDIRAEVDEKLNTDKKQFMMNAFFPAPIDNLGNNNSYFKALLDFRNAIEGWDKSFHSKKQYAKAIESYLKLLTEDSWVREKFMEYGGEPDWRELGVIMTKDGEVKRDAKRVLSES